VREEQALRRTIARYVHHATVVDDLFQEISLKVMRRIDSVRDQQAIRGWLFQLARNACLAARPRPSSDDTYRAPRTSYCWRRTRA